MKVAVFFPRNPDNCAMFVLKKNTSSHAVYPYYLDDVEGDRAMSSIDLAAQLRILLENLRRFSMASWVMTLVV